MQKPIVRAGSASSWLKKQRIGPPLGVVGHGGYNGYGAQPNTSAQVLGAQPFTSAEALGEKSI